MEKAENIFASKRRPQVRLRYPDDRWRNV